MFGRRLAVAAVTAVLIAGLGACAGDGSGGGDTGTGAESMSDWDVQQPTPDASLDTVSGLRDQVRHVTARTTRATRPHMVSKCTTGTRRVGHTTSTGTGAKRKTRTWYTTEHYRDCKQVHSGTETYDRLVRPERWCVSLDDVDGNKTRDDVWYEVDRSVYDEASGVDEHARVEFPPKGTGC